MKNSMLRVFILYIVPIIIFLVGLYSYLIIDNIMYGSCDDALFGCLRQIGMIVVVPIAWLLSTVYYYLSSTSKLNYKKKQIFFSILIYFVIEIIFIIFINFIIGHQ